MSHIIHAPIKRAASFALLIVMLCTTLFPLSALAASPTVSVSGKYAERTPGQPNRYYAAAQGGTAPYTYYFRLYKDGAVYQNSGWISADNYRVDFTEAGTYTMTVKVQDSNGLKSDFVSGGRTVVRAAQTLPTVKITGKYAEREPGQPNRYYAAAQGGAAPYTYYFRLYKGGVVCNNSGWIAEDNYRIDFTEAGTYTMTVKVQDRNGNKSDWVSCAKTVVKAAAVVPTVKVTGKYAAREAGQPNRYYAAAQGGAAPYTYYFRLYKGSTVYHNSGWIADDNYRIDFTEAGTYTMTVKVQDRNGNKSDWVSCAKTTVTASTIPTVTITGKYASLEAGQANRYYAAAQGGTAPYTYYFRLYKGGVVCNNSGWIADDNYRVDFTEAGTYTMTVKVQDRNGNKSDWVSCSRTTVTEAASEPLAVSVSARYTDLIAGESNTWYADGEGGTPPYTFYYRLYRDGEVYHNSGWVDDTEYDVSLDEPGDYVMHVKICDAQGNKSEFAAGGETTVAEEAALAAPTLSSVTAVSESEIKIKWKKVTGAVNYILYRSLKSSTGFEEIATVPATSAATYTYTDTSLSPDTTYYYKVQACSNTSEGKLSASKSATTDEEPVDEVSFSVNHAIEGDLLDKGAMRLINNNTRDENGDYPCSNWTIKSSEAWTVSASGATKWFELSASKGKAGTSKLKISVIDWTSTYQEAILTFKAGDNSYTVKIYQMADSYAECTLDLSLSGWTPTYKAATKSVTVTKHGSKAFTVSVQAEQDGEDDAWLSVTKSSSKLTVSARTNYGAVSRTGTVLVKCSCGQTHSLTVTQSAGAPAPTLQLTVGGSVYGPNDTYGPLANGGKDVLYVHASSTNAKRLFIQIEGAGAETFDSNVTGQENDFAVTIPKGLTPGTYTVTATATNSDVRNDTWSRKATTSFTLRVVSAGGTYGSLNTSALRAKLPAGKYWCHKPGEAFSAYSIMDTVCECTHRHGASRPGDGRHEKTDGSCGCNSYYGIQCWGYANLITKELFGSRADTWSKDNPGTDAAKRKETLNNVRPGDAIRYLYSGHTAVVLTVSDTGFTVTDCNWNENCRIRWDASVSKDYILNHGSFYVWKHP